MPNQPLKRKWNQDSHYYNQILKFCLGKKQQKTGVWIEWQWVGDELMHTHSFFPVIALDVIPSRVSRVSCKLSSRPAEEEAIPVSSPSTGILTMILWHWPSMRTRRVFSRFASPSTLTQVSPFSFRDSGNGNNTKKIKNTKTLLSNKYVKNGKLFDNLWLG